MVRALCTALATLGLAACGGAAEPPIEPPLDSAAPDAAVVDAAVRLTVDAGPPQIAGLLCPELGPRERTTTGRGSSCDAPELPPPSAAACAREAPSFTLSWRSLCEDLSVDGMPLSQYTRDARVVSLDCEGATVEWPGEGSVELRFGGDLSLARAVELSVGAPASIGVEAEAHPEGCVALLSIGGTRLLDLPPTGATLPLTRDLEMRFVRRGECGGPGSVCVENSGPGWLEADDLGACRSSSLSLPWGGCGDGVPLTTTVHVGDCGDRMRVAITGLDYARFCH